MLLSAAFLLFGIVGEDASSPGVHGAQADDMCIDLMTPLSDDESASSEVLELRALAKRLRAPGGVVEEPCVELEVTHGCACVRSALEPFYASLDDSAHQRGRAGVVVLGNSLIASDGIISVLRERLVERFGDGGRGLVLADRMASYGPRSRTAAWATGWRAETCADHEPETVPLGVTGVQHVSDGPARSRFTIGGERTAAVFWHDAKRDPRLSWRVDEQPWSPLPHTGDGVMRITEIDLPADAKSFELRAGRQGAVVQGVALDRSDEEAGVVVDTLGTPSADAPLWLTTDEHAFMSQLASRSPSLVVIMLGGNEIKWYGGKRSVARIEESLKKLIGRTRAAAKGSACLVVGPIDAVKPDLDADPPDPFKPRYGLLDVVGIERRVALEEGCAFFDLFAAMGGKGSLKRFHAASALHDDYMHPNKRGLDLLGQLFADALLTAYASSAPPARERLALSSFASTRARAGELAEVAASPTPASAAGETASITARAP